jgi:hypothetical protein
MANGNNNDSGKMPGDDFDKLQKQQDRKIASLKLEATQYEAIHRIQKDITSETKAQVANQKLQEAILHKNIQAGLQAGTDTDELAKKLAKIVIERQEYTKELEKQEELRKTAKDDVKSFGQLLGLAARKEETIIGKLLIKNREYAKGGVYAKAAKEQQKETFTIVNGLLSVMDKIIESTFAVAYKYDEAAAGFNKLTGEAGRYNDLISEMSKGNLQFGIGVVESAEAMGQLYTGMAAFTGETESTKKELSGLVAKLQRLGVDGGTSADILNTFTKGLGMSSIAAADLLQSITELDIGVSTMQLAQNIKEAEVVFLRFGETVGKKVFTRLTLQSKNLGIAMQDLVSIAEGLNTFESAAQMAGQLNAVLGGNLINSVELLTASYEDKIKIVRDSILQTGLDFKSLNQHEKQMFANIVAQGDLKKASKLLTVQTVEQIAKQKILDERMATTISVTEKLQYLMQSFAIVMQGPIDAFSSLLTGLTKFNEESGGVVKAIGYVIAALILMKVIGSLLAPVLGILAFFLPAVGAGSKAAGVGVRWFGRGAAAAAGPTIAFGLGMLKIGIAVALIGAGIWLVLSGFTALFKLFIDAAAGGGLLSVVGALATLPLIFGGIAITSTLAILPLLGVAAALGSIGLALKFIGKTDLFMLASFARGLGDFSSGNVAGVSKAMISLKAAFEAADNAGDDTIKRATALVKAMSAQNAAAQVGAISHAVPSGIQSSNARLASNSGGTTVILKINNREFGRAVLNSLEREMDLSVM